MEETSEKGEYEMHFACVVKQNIEWNFECSPYGTQEVSEGIKRMGHVDEPM